MFPVSARTGEGLEELVGRLAELLPEGPLLYPPDDLDRPAQRAPPGRADPRAGPAPHPRGGPARGRGHVDEVAERDDGLQEVPAQIWVENESQKGILIGKGGRMVREIGTAARGELERELGGQVFLDLEVRVRERWRRDDGLLDRLGIE